MKKYAAFCAAVAMALAQEKPKPGSIEGVVRAEAGGPPLADVDVYTGRAEAMTDSQGRFTLRDLPPGRHVVRAGERPRGPAATGTKTVVVQPGQTAVADFSLPLKGVISGRVVDEIDEPMPRVEVALLAPELVSGSVRYYRRRVALTNDEGIYRLESVQPGIAHVLLVRTIALNKLDAMSDAPDEPKLRRRAPVPTYYPGATEPEGATAIALRGGEHRESVDVRMLRAPSYCIEAKLAPRSSFQILEAGLTFGMSPSGGATGFHPTGDSGPDGRIRICDLHPGDYTLTAFTGDVNAPDSFSTIPVSVRDRDVRNVTLQPVPRLAPLTVEFVWAGVPPEKPAPVRVGVALTSLRRSFGAFASSDRGGVPGKVEIRDGNGGPLLDEYNHNVFGLTGPLYVKEIVYGSDTITYAPLRAGSAGPGSPIRVAVGSDGGPVKVRVTGRDGNAIPDAAVVVMPEWTASDAELSARLSAGQTDQNGDFVSRTLMPGKYLVISLAEPWVRASPEAIARLKSSRSQAREVTLEPNGTAEVTLTR